MTKPKFKATTGDCPVVEESFFQVSGQAERLFNIVTHYRPGHRVISWQYFLPAPIMPHYVNIAWEDYFLAVSFCLQGQRGSLTRR